MGAARGGAAARRGPGKPPAGGLVRCGQPGKNGGDGTGLAGSHPVKVAAVTARGFRGRGGCALVAEADAAALAVEVMLAAGRRGHDVAVTQVNGPVVFRLCALLLAELSAGRTEESND